MQQDMQIKWLSIDELTEYENNPRNNDGAVEKVAASIREFGWRVPIVIDTDGVIVAGHTRVKAARSLGLDKVPCIVADDLTPEQIKAYRLADNKTAEFAEWDFAKLDAELLDLADQFDMGAFGFSGNGGEQEQKEREDLSERVAETYEVIIECADEFEQEEVFDRLMGEGYKCRVLTL